MSWVVQHIIGRWYLSKGRDTPHGLTRHEADALRFATEADARVTGRAVLLSFDEAYEPVEIPDDAHPSRADEPDPAIPRARYGPTNVV